MSTSSSPLSPPGQSSYSSSIFSPYPVPNTSTNVALPIAALGVATFLILMTCAAAMWCKKLHAQRDQQSTTNGVILTQTAQSRSVRRRSSTELMPLEEIKVEGSFGGGSKEPGKKLGLMPVVLPGESDMHILAMQEKQNSGGQDDLSQQSRFVSALTDATATERSLSVMTEDDPNSN